MDNPYARILQKLNMRRVGDHVVMLPPPPPPSPESIEEEEVWEEDTPNAVARRLLAQLQHQDRVRAARQITSYISASPTYAPPASTHSHIPAKRFAMSFN